MNIEHLDSVLNDGLTIQMQVVRALDDSEVHSWDTVEEVWDLESHLRLKLYKDYSDSE